MEPTRTIFRSILPTGLLAVSLCLGAGPVQAADAYDVKTLFREGDWRVTLVHNAGDGSLWCTGETTNRDGQTFDITAFAGGGMALYVFDADWNIADRALRFLVDVDHSRWIMDGSGSDTSVSIALDGSDDSIRFLTDVSEGSLVAVLNADERRLATFMLNGSSAAISRLLDCWVAIAGNADDEAKPSDPFVGVSDPFD